MAGRGFASMDKKKQLEVASRGGSAAHASGKAYKWDSEAAKAASAKSVAVRRAKSNGLGISQ